MIFRLPSIATAALLTVVLLVAPAVWGSDGVMIPEISDLRRDAADAKSETGLIVVIATLENCYYCEVVKDEILQPLIRSGELGGVAVVRELAMDGLEIKDFTGEAQDPGRFADDYGARFSPTMLFLSPTGQ